MGKKRKYQSINQYKDQQHTPGLICVINDFEPEERFTIPTRCLDRTKSENLIKVSLLQKNMTQG